MPRPADLSASQWASLQLYNSGHYCCCENWNVVLCSHWAWPAPPRRQQHPAVAVAVAVSVAVAVAVAVAWLRCIINCARSDWNARWCPGCLSDTSQPPLTSHQPGPCHPHISQSYKLHFKVFKLRVSDPGQLLNNSRLILGSWVHVWIILCRLSELCNIAVCSV